MAGKTAELYRMVMPDHICPYGIKSSYLLEREGFEVEDHHLRSRAETDAFMDKHDVDTTPQTFIEGKRIGGYDDLRVFLGKDDPEPSDTTYQPVVALFSMALLTAIAAAYVAEGQWLSVRTVEWFVAFSMCGLAFMKLRDVEGFSTMFLNYDLLGRRWVPYAYFYPFAEGAAGVLMIAGVLLWAAVPLALFIGTIGAASVFKAVYVDKRELECACVGGDSTVPLGFVSLTENLMMVAIGLWMGYKALL